VKPDDATETQEKPIDTGGVIFAVCMGAGAIILAAVLVYVQLFAAMKHANSEMERTLRRASSQGYDFHINRLHDVLRDKNASHLDFREAARGVEQIFDYKVRIDRVIGENDKRNAETKGVAK